MECACIYQYTVYGADLLSNYICFFLKACDNQDKMNQRQVSANCFVASSISPFNGEKHVQLISWPL